MRGQDKDFSGRLQKISMRGVLLMFEKSFGGRSMFRKIVSTGFSVLMFLGLFLAAQSDGFAQQVMIRDYQEIVRVYQQSSFELPSNEAEYQRYSQMEGGLYSWRLDDLKQVHLKKQEYLLDAKKMCNQELTRINKNKCLEAINSGIQKDAGEYLQALKNMGRIFEERKRRLNDARKKFEPSQMKRTPQKRNYQRRNINGVDQQNRRTYERRTNRFNY